MILCLLPGMQLLRAQDQSSSAPATINTDRPAFTNSSVVVPKAGLVVENGFLETSTQGQRSFDFPESLLRFGVVDKTEVRLMVPDYYRSLSVGTGVASGWGDLMLGVKQQLGPVHGFDVSVIVMLSLPTGTHLISSHGYDPQVQLPWSRKLSDNWTAAGMFSVNWPTVGTMGNRVRNTTGQTTFLFDRQLAKPWDAFIEYAGNFPQSGVPQHILHLGTAYKITPHQQLDLHGGFGLSAAAPDHFIGVGYSFLLQRLQ